MESYSEPKEETFEYEEVDEEEVIDRFVDEENSQEGE